MTDRELKKLSRAQLLEMLLAQSKEVARLRRALEESQEQLEDRRIRMEKSGNLAEAALKLSGVYEAAQEAADRYLEEITAMQQDTRERCRKIEEQTRRNCEALTRTAREEAAAYWDAVREKVRDSYLDKESWQEILSLLEEKPRSRNKVKP